MKQTHVKEKQETINLKKDDKDIYELRKNLRSEHTQNFVMMKRALEINGWSTKKTQAAEEWINMLDYQYTVNWFFLHELKRVEGFWSWFIIVISTATSTLTLMDVSEYIYDAWLLGLASGFSVCTTLMAAWIKKENYVERIKLLDRHIIRITQVKVELNSQIRKAPYDRLEYTTFIEKFEPQVINILSDSPPMSPEEFKMAVWKLTKYYPELVKDIYPWYQKDPTGKYHKTTWGRDILSTYEAVYYTKEWRRLLEFYYCRCKCCRRKNKTTMIDFYNEKADATEKADAKLNIDSGQTEEIVNIEIQD